LSNEFCIGMAIEHLNNMFYKSVKKVLKQVGKFKA
jgi:hypothetical protein